MSNSVFEIEVTEEMLDAALTAHQEAQIDGSGIRRSYKAAIKAALEKRAEALAPKRVELWAELQQVTGCHEAQLGDLVTVTQWIFQQILLFRDSDLRQRAERVQQRGRELVRTGQLAPEHVQIALGLLLDQAHTLDMARINTNLERSQQAPSAEAPGLDVRAMLLDHDGALESIIMYLESAQIGGPDAMYLRHARERLNLDGKRAQKT